MINYPNEHAYTRITEFKYLTGQEHPKTSIVYEYPRAEGDPVLSDPAARERSALQEVQSSGRTDAGRAFRRTPGHLQVLQHGPGHGSGSLLFKKLKAEATNEPPKKRALVQAAVGHTSLTSIVEVATAMRSEDSGDFQADAA